MWIALIPTPLSVGSTQAATGRPLRARAAATAVRSSTMCAVFTTVLPAISGSSLNAFGFVLNVAVADRAAVIETVQLAVVPLQAPLQPVNVAPVVGLAVRVAVEPAA